MKWLLAHGYTYAFDASNSSVNSAFYQLTSTGGLTLNATHNIIKSSSEKMINLIRGVSLGSFIYSVSPNTGGAFTHNCPVPIYATANGNFPSGFEVEVVGPASNRQVFARIVMAAKGSFKGFMAYEQNMLIAARDLW